MNTATTIQVNTDELVIIAKACRELINNPESLASARPLAIVTYADAKEQLRRRGVCITDLLGGGFPNLVSYQRYAMVQIARRNLTTTAEQIATIHRNIRLQFKNAGVNLSYFESQYAEQLAFTRQAEARLAETGFVAPIQEWGPVLNSYATRSY